MPFQFEREDTGYFRLTLEPGTPAELRVRGHEAELNVLLCPERLGRYLQHLRTSGDRESIRTVSASTGLSTGYLSKIENGAVKGPPGLGVLRKLADHHEIGLDSLLVLSGAERPQEQGETQNLDQAFFRLVTQAELRPDGLRDEELRWFAPQVKRHWLNFARNLLQAVRDGDVDPDSLLGATEVP